MINTLFKTFLLAVIFINSTALQAQNNSLTKSTDAQKLSKEVAKQWLAKGNQFGFRENKGQMADEKGKPVSFVLYSVCKKTVI